VSDKLQPFSGKVHARLLDFSGNVLFEKTQDVQIPAASSAIYLTLDEKEMFVDPSDQDSAKIGRRSSFLVADMEVDGKSRSRNLAFFDVTHNLELPMTQVWKATLLKRLMVMRLRCNRRPSPAVCTFLLATSTSSSLITILTCCRKNLRPSI